MSTQPQSIACPLLGIALGGFVFSAAVASIEGAVFGTTGWSIATLLPPFEFWPAFGAPAIGLLVELCIVGWQRSALRSLLVERLPSALSDLAYMVLYLTGGAQTLAVLVAFGLVGWSERWAEGAVGLLPLRDLSLWIQLPLLWLYMSFVAYCQHRALHTKFLWAFHRSHHSPQQFTLINTFRIHPVAAALSAVVNTLALAVAGFSTGAIAIFGVYALFAALFLHSRLTRLAWLERIGLCTPAGHLLHHGRDPRYHDRNFGDLTNIWDRLFGTYLAPQDDVDMVEIGVDAPAGHHNTMRPFREIALQTMGWAQAMRSEPARLLPRGRRAAPMLRLLLLALLIAVLSPQESRAFNADGATAPLTDFGGGHGLSLALFGIDSANRGGTEELPLQLRIGTVGIAWTRDGWSVGLAAGRVQYGIPAVIDVAAPLAAVSIGHELAGVAGGTISMELRASRLFADDGAIDVFASALRWTLKF